MKTFFYIIESPYKTTDIDLSFHSMKKLSPDYHLYWRIFEEQKEIEFVIRVNSTTWVGLGWRPRNLTSSCKNFPLIHDINDNVTMIDLRSSLSELSAEPKPEPEPEPASEPEPKAEPEPEPNAEPEPEPTAEPEPNTLSSKSKRVASNQFTTPKDGITVATSVSYRVSAKTGNISLFFLHSLFLLYRIYNFLL